MANDLDIYPGQIARIEIDKSAAICVEQIEDEITIVIASVVGVHFDVTADQALALSAPWRSLQTMLRNLARQPRGSSRGPSHN